LFLLFSLHLFSTSHLKNGHHSKKIKKYLSVLPLNVIAKLYRARCERLLLMNHGIPEDIRWMIEAKV